MSCVLCVCVMYVIQLDYAKDVDIGVHVANVMHVLIMNVMNVTHVRYVLTVLYVDVRQKHISF